MSGAAGSLPSNAPFAVCVSDSLWLVDNVASARVDANSMMHFVLRTSSKSIGATHAWHVVECFEQRDKISQVLNQVQPEKLFNYSITIT